MTMRKPEPAAPRLVRRVVVLEEPRVYAQVQRRARQRGHSVAAEYRGAVRRLLRDDQD
jgi:hypothetical protein